MQRQHPASLWMDRAPAPQPCTDHRGGGPDGKGRGTARQSHAHTAAARDSSVHRGVRGCQRLCTQRPGNRGWGGPERQIQRSLPPTDIERRGLPERSEEHTSELQSLRHLVCRLLLEKKKKKQKKYLHFTKKKNMRKK